MGRRRAPAVKGPLIPGGNGKLGPLPWTFSIPALLTCTGSTPACEEGCYALGFLFQRAAERHQGNWDLSREAKFLAAVVGQIRRYLVTLIRIHVAGDFYTVAYLETWIRIARLCPSCTFWFYTRAWRNRDGTLNEPMLRALERMARLPNVHVWFSEDRDSGPSPTLEGVRVAWTVFRVEDQALVPARADLVFRDKSVVRRTPPTKRISGVQVCPYEDGVARLVDPAFVERKVRTISCSDCRICWTAPRVVRPPL